MGTRFKLFMSKLWTFLKPAIKIFLSGAGSVLATVALNTVIELQSSDLSNEEKRSEAFKNIKESLKNDGANFSDSAINLAIEVSLQKIKESLENSSTVANKIEGQ